jgi:hypothetical protein
MNLKRFGMALVAVLAIAAVTASSALAAATTTDVQWNVAGKIITSPQKVTSSGSGTLRTTIGATNHPVTLTASGISCIECTIKNEGGTAIGTGYRTFDGVKVTEPAHCKVLGESVKTNLLEFSADWMIGTVDYIKIVPETGSIFAQVSIETDGTGSCTVSGKYNTTGVIFVKTNNATKTFVAKQEVTASQAINEEASGLTEPLKLEGHKAELSGTVAFEAEGKAFGTE